MLDLKSKLLAAGLVTEEQVDKVKQEEEERRQRRKEARAKRTPDGGKKPGGDKGSARKGRSKGGRGPAKENARASDERVDAARWKRRLEQLQGAGKSEQYDAIRAWVQRARIDAVKAIPTEEAERFHFARHDSGIASLVLEPEIKTRVVGGDAAISAYMSHNGMAHCVVPREVALDIAALRPEWVRVLEGYEVVPNQDERKPETEGEGDVTDVDAQSPEAGLENVDDNATGSSALPLGTEADTSSVEVAPAAESNLADAQLQPVQRKTPEPASELPPEG